MRKNRTFLIAVILILLLAALLGTFYLFGPFGNQAPTAAFKVTPAGEGAPLEMSLDGSPSSDPDGTVTDHAWDFGDGKTGKGASVRHQYAKAGKYEVRLTVTDDRGATHTHSRTLNVRLTPRLVSGLAPLEISPEDGAAVSGGEAYVRWRAPATGEGRVLWRRQGEEEYREAEATPGPWLLAKLAPLETGAKYEYLIENQVAELGERSPVRTFSVERGVAFEKPVAEESVKADYDQTVKLTLRNESDRKVRVAARALAEFPDLQADIVGPGSADEPVEVAPGAVLVLRLAIAAPSPQRDVYEIPVEAGGAYVLVRLRIVRPQVRLNFKVADEDAHTLARTVEIHNDGDTLADVAVRVPAEHAAAVRIEPAARHCRLPAGKTLVVVVTPILYLEFRGLTLDLECVAGGKVLRCPLEFKAPAGRRLVGVRTGGQERTASRDWYCTNKPATCSDLPGPHGNGPLLAAPGRITRPRQGPCAADGPDHCPCNDPAKNTGVAKGDFRRGPDGNPAAFDTPEAAALAALRHVNALSAKLNLEYRGRVVRIPGTEKWGWTIDCEGSAECVGKLGADAAATPATWQTYRGRPSLLPCGLADLSWTHEAYLAAADGSVLRYPVRKNRPGGPEGSGPAVLLEEKALAGDGAPTLADSASDLLRPGLLEALARRAAFTRAHRGPFAARLAGKEDDSSAFAAGWHAGTHVLFAWHQDKDVVLVAEFDVTGAQRSPPIVLGKGRWPQLAADAERVAVAWERDKGSVVRIRSGKGWGEEIELPGIGPSLAFSPKGELYVVTTLGLWKLTGKQPDTTAPSPREQPALAIDAAGRPVIAWCRGGRVVVEGEEVGTGGQPALLFAGGELHLAYAAEGTVHVHTRKEKKWGPAVKLPARGASWPALAVAEGGVRLTYLAPAGRGPDALWLTSLPKAEPVLVPSLAGNVTDAYLLLHFGLKGPRNGYRPHDAAITFNGCWVHLFEGTVPEGRYLFRLHPYHVFTSAGRPVANRVAVRTRHMNGGHYSVSSDYELIVRTAWGEHFAYAADESGAAKAFAADRRLNDGKPDLALLANGLDLPVTAPKGESATLPVTVANLGEVPSRAAIVVLRAGDKELARADVLPLRPGEDTVVAFRLDGSLKQIELRLEQKEPDFDPSNDVLTLHLWAADDAQLAKASAVALPSETDETADVATGEIDPESRLKYQYDSTARFGLEVVKDHAGKKSGKQLTYSPSGGTNSTVVRIDGKDLAFGSGKLLRHGAKLPPDPDRKAVDRSESVWESGGIRVTQTLEIVPGRQPVEVSKGVRKRLMDTCAVRYRIENRDKKPHKVGLRLQIDTLIGGNDGVPFAVPGLDGLVTTFKDFRGGDVPEFVQALEKADLRDPGTVAHLTLRRPGLEAPGRLSLTNWPGSGSTWEVPVTNMGSDSAAVLYWLERELAPGEARELGFAYGLSSVSQAGGGARLAVNVEGRFQAGKAFTALAYVHNPAPGETLTLVLPEGLELAGGRVQEAVPPLPAGVTDGNSLLSWKVRALWPGQFRVAVRSSAGAEEVRTVTVAARPPARKDGE